MITQLLRYFIIFYPCYESVVEGMAPIFHHVDENTELT